MGGPLSISDIWTTVHSLLAFFQSTPTMQCPNDPRRPERIVRYVSPQAILNAQNDEKKDAPNDDLTPDYMNVLGMIFSMCALMMRIKWCGWVAVYCSCISFANTKYNDDTKQIMSSFMLSISAVVMSYLQNPMPMTLPFSG